MPERRRKYSPEYRDEAVKMVIETSRLMQNPNYSQSGVSQGSLSRKLATRRVK
jgi:transposase-like protein